MTQTTTTTIPASTTTTTSTTPSTTTQDNHETFTITWVHYDWTVLEIDKEVPYGQMPEYNGITPTREGEEAFHYVFVGWEPIVSAVTRDRTYIAQFEKSINTYSITWQNEDGTILYVDGTVPYGTLPTYLGDLPAKAETKQYLYQFAGWTPAIETAKEDKIYIATYEATLQVYQVSWLNDDQTLLFVQTVPYGETPSLPTLLPTKEGNEQFTYEFKQWTPEILEVQDHQTYFATYTEIVNTYSITWYDGNGSLLKTDAFVPYGSIPSYEGNLPTKQSTSQYHYQFLGWDKELTSVKGNQTYSAVFEAIPNVYTVTFQDLNGFILAQVELPYGSTPTYDFELPTQPSSVEFDYLFDGWYPTLETVESNQTYTALFKQTTRTYLISWVDDQGILLTSELVPYGSLPVFPHGTPIKEADAQYTYLFRSWNQEIVPVTQETTYIANFDISSTREYEVTWSNYDGTILYSITVPYGTTISHPELSPRRDNTEAFTYTFIGWSPSDLTITNTTSFIAQYEEKARMYMVRWVDRDQNNYSVILKEESFPYGSVPVYSGSTPFRYSSDSSKEYRFVGWTPQLAPITRNTFYYAEFELVPVPITVRFFPFSLQPIENLNFLYGDVIHNLPIPTRDGCVFEGWYLDGEYKDPIQLPYTINSTGRNRTLAFYAKWSECSNQELMDEFYAIYNPSIEDMNAVTLEVTFNNQEMFAIGLMQSGLMNQYYSTSSSGESWIVYYDDYAINYQQSVGQAGVIVTRYDFTYNPSYALTSRYFSSTFAGSSPGFVVSFPYYLANTDLANISNLFRMFYISYDATLAAYRFDIFAQDLNSETTTIYYYVRDGKISHITSNSEKSSMNILATLHESEDPIFVIPNLPESSNYQFRKNIVLYFSDGTQKTLSNLTTLNIQDIQKAYPNLLLTYEAITSDDIYLDETYQTLYPFEPFESVDTLHLYIKLYPSQDE